MTGSGTVEHQHFFDNTTGTHEERLYEEFNLSYFNPPLHIFKIPDKSPDLIRKEIIDSFKLFWFDLPSCANKLRSSLEVLLNEEKLNKFFKKKNGKRKRYTLNDRVGKYK